MTGSFGLAPEDDDRSGEPYTARHSAPPEEAAGDVEDHSATALLPAGPHDSSRRLAARSAPTSGQPRTADVYPPNQDAGADRAQPSDGAEHLARNSTVMAAGSAVSRVTGLVRNSVLVAAVGSHLVGDAYTVANALPNMVYELLIGGVLASVVIPLLVQARNRDADRGEAYAQRLLTLTILMLGGATVLAIAGAPLLSGLFSSGASRPESEALRTQLTYLLLPEIFFYGVAAIIAAILNTRGHFAAPMWTPILNNIVVIGACVAFIVVPSPHDRSTGPLTMAQILILGLGTTLGIVVQAVGLIPALRRVGFRWRWRWDFRQLHLRRLLRLSSWVLVYVAVSQVGVTVVVKLAQASADIGGSGPIVFNNAFLVFMMASGIIAVSIMTALMPRMSAAAAEGRLSNLAQLFSQGTRLSAVILVPATAAYVLLAHPLAVVLFQYGAYDRRAAADTATVIAVAGTGLLPFAISQLQLFAFYAMSDTRTPAISPWSRLAVSRLSRST